MKSAAIGKRLLSASEFVRQGAYFADIGTDHAYLPIFLLSEGRIERAVCADINEGPLDNAKKSSAEYGLTEKIDFVLADGAEGLSELGITDYAICGMGGELIADIIDRAPHFKREGIRLVLQPMSRQSVLRRYLAESGFSVVGENYSAEGGKYYLCLAAEYTGEVRHISDFEAEFGITDTRVQFSEAQRGYFDVKIRALRRAACGKELAGEADSFEARLLSQIEKYMREGVK